MENIILMIIIGLVGFAIGCFVFWLFSKTKNQNIKNKYRSEYDTRIALQEQEIKTLEKTRNELNEKIKEYEIEIKEILTNNTELEKKVSKLETMLSEEKKITKEKLDVLEDAKKNLKNEFENLSNKIFDEKSKKFTEYNKDKLDPIINPLKDQIKDFKKKVEDVYEKESKDRNSLYHEIKHLKDLNNQLSKDANNLTNALKSDPKKQGNWGEMILEKVLEESGLRKGHEYETLSLHDEEGKLKRPDAIVRLPDNKDVIIDAKVTLKAYENYHTFEEDSEKQNALNEYLVNINNHIKDLSNKRYEDLPDIRSLDYVLMFVPIESAFMTALENDRNLFNKAFDKKIVLVSPSTLLVVLKTIQNIWRFEYQTQNATDIAKKAGDLYDKFCGFIDALKDIGHHLNKANESYETAFSRLTTGRGNLISKAETIKSLGLKTKKELPKDLIEKSTQEHLVFENREEAL